MVSHQQRGTAAFTPVVGRTNTPLKNQLREVTARTNRVYMQRSATGHRQRGVIVPTLPAWRIGGPRRRSVHRPGATYRRGQGGAAAYEGMWARYDNTDLEEWWAVCGGGGSTLAKGNCHAMLLAPRWQIGVIVCWLGGAVIRCYAQAGVMARVTKVWSQGFDVALNGGGRLSYWLCQQGSTCDLWCHGTITRLEHRNSE